VGLAIEEHVENDVGVHQEAFLHRYFFARCWL
jgi:hypothetical protein